MPPTLPRFGQPSESLLVQSSCHVWSILRGSDLQQSEAPVVPLRTCGLHPDVCFRVEQNYLTLNVCHVMVLALNPPERHLILGFPYSPVFSLLTVYPAFFKLSTCFYTFTSAFAIISVSILFAEYPVLTSLSGTLSLLSLGFSTTSACVAPSTEAS